MHGLTSEVQSRAIADLDALSGSSVLISRKTTVMTPRFLTNRPCHRDFRSHNQTSPSTTMPNPSSQDPGGVDCHLILRPACWEMWHGRAQPSQQCTTAYTAPAVTFDITVPPAQLDTSSGYQTVDVGRVHHWFREQCLTVP